MNRLLATVALLGAFTSTSAFAEVGISWAWNNEVTAEYSVDAEKTIMDYEPEMNISLTQDWGLDIGTKIPLYDSTATDSVVAFDVLDEGSRPNINFEVNYGGFGDNIELYGKTHWDIDAEERGEVTVGMSFSF